MRPLTVKSAVGAARAQVVLINNVTVRIKGIRFIGKFLFEKKV
jgi:hypothetical protein